MATTTLEKTLQTSWKEVKHRYGDPPLDNPKLNTFGNETAHINMQNNEIVVFQKFVELLAKHKVPPELSTRALLYHEAGHYMVCPFDMKRTLKLIKAAEEIAPGKGRDIANYYTDLVVNLECVNELTKTHIESIYSADMSNGNPHKLELVLNNLYNNKTKGAVKKWKYSLSDDLKHRLKKISILKYKARHWLGKGPLIRTQEREVKRFAEIIKDLLDDPLPENSVYTGIGDLIPANAQGEVAGAIGEIAKECSPKEMKDLLDALEDSGYSFSKSKGDSYSESEIIYDEKSDKQKNPKPSKKPSYAVAGDKSIANQGSQGTIDQIVDHYSALASDLVVIPEETESGLVKTGYEKWTIDKSISTIDPFQSAGKFIPGITIAKRFGQEEGDKKDKALPDCVIALDTSGSMGDPYGFLSASVLAAFSSAKTYLSHGKKVGVINFSSSTKITNFSKDEKKVYKALGYHQGGGTSLDIVPSRNLLKKAKSVFDFVVITDGYISNINEVLKFADTLPGRNRMTFLDIGSSPNQDLQNYALKNSTNTTYFHIKKADDLAEIAVGEAMKSFGG